MPYGSTTIPHTDDDNKNNDAILKANERSKIFDKGVITEEYKTEETQDIKKDKEESSTESNDSDDSDDSDIDAQFVNDTPIYILWTERGKKKGGKKERKKERKKEGWPK